jgi:hypothetical protein
MTTTNSSTKKTSNTKRSPIVQVVLQQKMHEQFIKRCESEQRSESSMGAILIAQALNTDSESSNTSAL